MTVILGETAGGAERYRLTLGAKTPVVKSPRELLDYIEENPDELLVVVGAETTLKAALEIAKHFRAVRPALGVILVRQRLEVSTLSKAMQAGVREVVSADDAAELLAATKRSLEVSETLADKQVDATVIRRGKLILVFSAKGGCGKTTLSTNLAHVLASDPDKSVCLADFDLQFGDVAVAMQLEPTKTISDAIRMEQSLDLQGIQSLVTHVKPNLDVLMAPLDPADVEFITPDLAQKILRGLKDSYDYVVVDAPPAFTEVILRAFDLADRFLLLTTLDTPSLKNLKVTLGTLAALGMPRNKWHIVVNRATAKSGISLSDVQTAIGMEISATIPDSEFVPIAINQGHTVVELQPGHAVAKAFKRIGEDITGGRLMMPPKKTKAKSEKKRGFFGRSKKSAG
jgi:pilus assembly protein CpaE